MKKTFHPLLAAAIGVCLAAPALASAPSTSAELKQDHQLVAKGGKFKASKSPKKSSKHKGAAA